MKWHCEHTATEVRGMRIHGGGIQYRHQCLSCGRSVGPPIAHSQVAQFVEWDSQLQPKWEEAARAASRAALDERDGKWRDAYAAYLASDEWRKRRQAVLARDGGICRGCLTRPATEVHHLSYEHVGRELAFELISLCAPCHERVHSQGAAQEFDRDA